MKLLNKIVGLIADYQSIFENTFCFLIFVLQLLFVKSEFENSNQKAVCFFEVSEEILEGKPPA